MFNSIVVGSGLSGSILARELAENGQKILLIEKRNELGGNIIDEKQENIWVHKYGPHIFHTSSDIVFEYMKKYWKLNNYTHSVDVFVKDKIVPIPFNFKAIDVFFPDDSEEIKSYLKEKYPNEKKVSILKLMDSKNEKISMMSKFVFENIFLNYTTKMWGKKPSEIDKSVIERVPVNLSYDTTYFSDKYEGTPSNGYSNTIKNILDHKNIEIKVGIDAKDILTFKDNKVIFNNEEYKGNVFYSGPLDELFDYKYGVLPYRSLSIKFETLDQEFFQSKSVVNYPGHPEMTRITEYKHFNNDTSKKTVISKEYPGNYDMNSKDFNIPYYPMATDEARNKYSKYLELTKDFKNFYPIGRLAEYKYINMDQAILNSLELSKKILGGNNG